MAVAPVFDLACERCPRLARHLREVRAAHPDYHGRPVAPFGDPAPAILVVGLAPGLHGANATGRPFTGDYAGILLYETLFAHGLSSAPQSRAADDGLHLHGCRITNAVKCLPPQNKPTVTEVATCNAYLRAELATLPRRCVIVGLGRIAHQAVIRALGLRQGAHAFAHGAVHRVAAEQWLVDSYHCSRYNTQTGRLTAAMFGAVFDRATELARGA